MLGSTLYSHETEAYTAQWNLLTHVVLLSTSGNMSPAAKRETHEYHTSEENEVFWMHLDAERHLGSHLCSDPK